MLISDEAMKAHARHTGFNGKMRKGNGSMTTVKPSVSEYFGELTFGLGQMREKLPREGYQGLLRTLEQSKKLTRDVADAIALVVKEWAVSKGCTHFCHWFQPMTGLTAEKHDAFISIQTSYHSELRVTERFTGGQLIQGEPDASSFPSGGMRSTFEARGYTAWDPSSPMFILEGEQGHTLCIPSVFFGYHGEALDNKTPLLRSVAALSREACEFLRLLGDVDVKSVQSTLGTEQEYFIIDRGFVARRPDLVLTGRTLLGAPSPRGQQLEDHYFGSIPTRVKAFMEDVEVELFRLGVPIKTRHNEVAPSQFEVAPIFENANIAADHNTLTMDMLKRVANRNGLTCLLHEKPFAGINGSGKHCNWSMSNDKGENLLDPGTTPHQNLRFLAMAAVVLKAVHDHSDVLRASIASPGNDHRLGGNEAPPAIISVFLGSLLDRIYESIEKGEAARATEQQIINLGISQIPDISKDYTDRNRTSPFAFTGNKFEFRAVGASASVAVPITVLNTAVADAFCKASDQLKALLGNKSGRDEAVMELIRGLAKETKNIRFEGNNYSKEWQREAKKRGLPIFDTTVESLEVLNRKDSVEFLTRMGVLTAAEIASRYHVAIERYVKTVEIEIATLVEMAGQYVIPILEKQLVETATAHKVLGGTTVKKLHETRVGEMEEVLEMLLKEHKALMNAFAKLHEETSETKKAHILSSQLMPMASRVRQHCDRAELFTEAASWPLPKYREMLFAHTIS
jgi:glutamine synthetase